VQIDGLRRQSFAVRYLTLFGGEAFSKLCVMAAFAYMARVLSPAEYGIVELALAVTVFFVVGVEGGMGLYGARVVAAQPERIPTLVPQVMLLRGLLALPAFVAMLAVARYHSAGLGLVGVTAIAVLMTPFLTQWVFQGLRQMQWVAGGTALRNFTFVAVILLVLRPGVDLRLIGVAEVCGVGAMALFCSLVLFGRLRARLDFRARAEGTRRLFRDVWFMGLGDFAWACLWYSPALALGWIDRQATEEVAWVGAPVRVVLSLHTFVFLYFFNLLPNLAIELTRGVDAWRAVIVRSLRATTWPAILVAVGGTVAAPVLMPLIFGDAYVAATRPFQIAIWMIPVTWFSGHFRFSLIAAGHQQREFMVSLATAVVTVTAAIIFGLTWGSIGAATALLTGGVANALLAVAVSHRTIGRVPIGVALVPDVREWMSGPRDSV
jgi:O-antigen/teichoic acid export membrane protein